MILFKDKSTGQIIGKIDGRVHSEAQLKMWIGDPETTERVIIDWEVVGEEPVTEEVESYESVGTDENGDIYRKQVKQVTRMRKIWQPRGDKATRDIVARLDRREMHIRDLMFKGDKLVKNTRKREVVGLPKEKRSKGELQGMIDQYLGKDKKTK